MANSFGSFCDGLFVDMCINTQLELPSSRETVLAFFERLQKQKDIEAMAEAGKMAKQRMGLESLQVTEEVDVIKEARKKGIERLRAGNYR